MRDGAPAVPEGLAEGDRYVPLIRLESEDGAWWGDGAAYIEHRVSAPKGGRNLYVWMGLVRHERGREILDAIWAWVKNSDRRYFSASPEK